MVELLVVIAIIAILVSMLLPALSTANKIGKRASCLGNLKNIGTGISMYTGDWIDYIPIAWDGSRMWTKMLHDDYVKGSVLTYQCPGGSIAKTPSDFSVHSDKTYGMFYANANSPFYGMGSWITYLKITSLQSPSRHAMLTDTINLADAYLRQCYCVGPNQPWADSKINLRHLGVSTVFFADGHLEGVNAPFWRERINSNYLY